jgi:putative peptidoglycan lipid II flippase
VLIQLRSLRDGGFRWAPAVDVRDPAAREALALMAPRAAGLGVSQLTFVVSTSLASSLATGSITAFNVAFTILQIPIGVIGVPLGVVVFPSLARDLARGGTADYLRLLTQSLRLLLFVMLPLTALALVLRTQLVAVLFGYGQFGEPAINLTADTLAFFLLGLAAHSLIAVLARAFYAGRDTRTPVMAAILAVVVNVALGVALVGPMGLPGLSLAIAVGAWAEAILLLEILRRRYRDFDGARMARAFGEAAIAAALAGVAAFAVLQGVATALGPVPGTPGLLLELAVASAAGGLVFLAAAVALRIPELPTIVAVVADLIRRPSRPSRPSSQGPA